VPPTLAPLCADFNGIPVPRVSDQQDFAGLTLAAANGAGLLPAVPLCHGGHGVSETGGSVFEVAGLRAAPLHQEVDVVVRRLGVHQMRADRRHGHSVAAEGA
jgi:hypothetical protein